MNKTRSMLLAVAAAALAAAGCGTETVNDSAAVQQAYKDRKAPVMPANGMAPKGGAAFVGKPISIGGPPGASGDHTPPPEVRMPGGPATPGKGN